MELLPSPILLIGESYQLMLKESIDRFLEQSRNGNSDFADFTSIFLRLLHARVDPPLETIWFYSAVRFRSVESVEKPNLLGRVSRVKDLFQLLTSCSASCDGLKSVAVICPVVMELYQLVVELWKKKKKSGSGSSSSLTKMERKAEREVECLVEGVVGYVSLCGCEDYGRDDVLGESVSCLGDLIRVWTAESAEGNVGVGGSLRVFFPVVSDEVREGFGNGELGGGYLVGVVIVQAFLLRLCLKVLAGTGLSRLELEKELSTLAVGSITAFRNCCFFEVLLRLLMEPTLPVTSLLDSKDEALLRKVLYDVVILGEYSFLNIEREMVPTSNCLKRLSLRRLILVHEATQKARENKDHAKAISYMNAFSKSCLPSNLVKWATSQIGIDEETSKPNVTTPQALLKWLLNLENRGARIFDNNSLKARAKLALDECKAGYEHRLLQPESKVEEDLLFYIDNKPEGETEKVGDQEMTESMDAPFIAAVRTMKFTAEDKRRKRKEERKGGEKTKVKFQKYHLNDSSLKENPSPPTTQGDITSDSEENHISDEDMNETED